ncbi:MAG: YebG family protein [Desulfobacterales bacterium]|nr:YebG family protein [Desulfobacterales bacterium]
MAVIVKYIVVRDGEEKMTFATKKEADAHDKMLDIADNVFDFLDASDLKLDEELMESVSLLMAQRRDEVIPLLKGSKPKAAKPKDVDAKPKAKAKSKTTAKAAAKGGAKKTKAKKEEKAV